MAHLWKSFVDALAPPRQSEQPRRGGVTLNCMVDKRQLPRHEPSNRPEDQSSRAVPESQEVWRADLNRLPARKTSARVAEVDASSDEEFQDSKEILPPRPLAESITAARIPQVATSQTAQLQSDLTVCHIEQQTGPVESPQTPSSVESANARSYCKPVGGHKIFS